ncbi:DUF4166 domain-containing protein [Microbacterium sp. bgisy189]|uniref:DUF4166 domain-containing protein n=1 Tax=Microbacterium sp. bgisy189 TaxID=3413798 RepID=UPI003EC0D746
MNANARCCRRARTRPRSDAAAPARHLRRDLHLAVDLDLDVDESGALLLTSQAQRFYEGPIGFRFPMLLSGRARLRLLPVRHERRT